MRRSIAFRLGAAALAVVGAYARAQPCTPHFSPAFAAGDLNGPVAAMAAFDDGSGQALYVGGSFTSASGLPVAGLARWDGESWSAVEGPGGGLGGAEALNVTALGVADEGSGPALFAAGNFTTAGGAPAAGIARWSGRDWSPLGAGITGGLRQVRAITGFDDGSGPAVYVAGRFSSAGGVAAMNVARWRNGAWSALGDGVEEPLYALAVYNDGLGDRLYAGGAFFFPQGPTSGVIVEWTGTRWESVGGGVGGPGYPYTPGVYALATFRNNMATHLYMAGNFLEAGGAPVERIARWDGVAWAPLAGGGLDGNVSALAVFNDGSGEALYAAGVFSAAGGVAASRIARWDGSSWSALGSGVEGGTFAQVSALAAFDPPGPAPAAVFAGGDFTTAGGVDANRIAAWDGSAWDSLSPESREHGVDSYVQALGVFSDRSGDVLYIGGSFTRADGLPAERMVKYDGENFIPMPGLSGPAYDMVVHDDGRGVGLFVGGSFISAGGVTCNNIAVWNGSSWAGVGGGVTGGTFAGVEALAVYDDGGGPDLYAAGSFTHAGGQPASNVARWDGSQWTDVGGGTGGSIPNVYDLVVYHENGADRLFAAGYFETAGRALARMVARWDGSAWGQVGAGVAGISAPAGIALAVYDDGTGPALFLAGNNITMAGGVPVKNAAKWDGSAWSAVGAGLDSAVHSLGVFDDGTGPALYAGGAFLNSGTTRVNSLARWNGSAWGPVAGGVRLGTNAPTSVQAFAEFGGSLFIGGNFTLAGGISSPYLAEWVGCRACYADCDESTGPGVLDIFDFLCFQNRYATGAPYACDCDVSTGQGTCDVFDFLCFQNAYAAGCP